MAHAEEVAALEAGFGAGLETLQGRHQALCPSCWSPSQLRAGQAAHTSSPPHTARSRHRYNLPAQGQQKEQTCLPQSLAEVQAGHMCQGTLGAVAQGQAPGPEVSERGRGQTREQRLQSSVKGAKKGRALSGGCEGKRLAGGSGSGWQEGQGKLRTADGALRVPPVRRGQPLLPAAAMASVPAPAPQHSQAGPGTRSWSEGAQQEVKEQGRAPEQKDNVTQPAEPPAERSARSLCGLHPLPQDGSQAARALWQDGAAAKGLARCVYLRPAQQAQGEGGTPRAQPPVKTKFVYPVQKGSEKADS